MLFPVDESDELGITQAQVSIFLGVRHESITVAAQKLETICAIQYQRGHPTVVNRRELEELAGESYAVVSKEYERFYTRCPRLADAVSRIP